MSTTPDPIPDLIAEILQMEGMHPDTRRLIELAIQAQRTGALPAFIPAKARQLGMSPFPEPSSPSCPRS